MNNQGTCQQMQLSLSLYLYGELAFDKEEELELHLECCSFCQLALSREKAWHASLNTERQDVPLELLSQCRRELRNTLYEESSLARRGRWVSHVLEGWQRFGLVRLASNRWSPQLAFASLFLFLGFSLSKWTDRIPGLDGWQVGRSNQAGLAPSFSRVRAVEGGDDNRVRIVVDRIRQQELIGSVSDAGIRELLLQGSKDSADPGLRVDAVELLNGHDGLDIRDALLYSVTHDDNAAVRLKALEGLRRFQNDGETREVLLQLMVEDTSPAVRAEAIDALQPTNTSGPMSPDFRNTLQSIIDSSPGDDYFHARCLQILQAAKHHNLY